MKTLFISLKGLGDTVYLIPAINSVWRRYGEPVTVVVRDRKSVELFRNCAYVRPVLLEYMKTDPASLLGHLRTLLRLRAEKYDVSLTSFPSNRLVYNLFAFFAGAGKRATHAYDYAAWRTLPFLQNCRVRSERRRHAVEKNMDLLACLGLDPRAEKIDMGLWLAPSDEESARAFLAGHGIDARADVVVGVHPSISRAQVYKNWAPENIKIFAGLLDWLNGECGAKTLVFAGPDEAEAAGEIMALAKEKQVPVPGADINTVAALLKSCRLFINTDSGLGTVAAAVGTPCITVLGATDPLVTAPYGANNTAITSGLACAPCYKYPYSATSPSLGCPHPACMGPIDAEKIKKAVRERLGPPKA